MSATALWSLLPALVTAILTWVTRRYALRRGLMDTPGERRSHTVPTPRGGGIAIVVTVLLACVWTAWYLPNHLASIASFSTGLVLVAAIGWVDDHRPSPPWQRFVVHLVCASLLANALMLESLPCWQVVLGWFCAVGLINIWNFMDGINGLAVSQAAIAAVGFACVLPLPWAIISWVLVWACLGFLPFNFRRARIFLGDVGSGSLGYLIAGFMAFSVLGAPSPWLVLLPVVVFGVDAGFTLFRRVLRREAWWQPHTTHAYQRAARRLGHTKVTLLCALFSAIATLLMLVAWPMMPRTGLSITVCVYVLAFLIWLQQQMAKPSNDKNAQ